MDAVVDHDRSHLLGRGALGDDVAVLERGRYVRRLQGLRQGASASGVRTLTARFEPASRSTSLPWAASRPDREHDDVVHDQLCLGQQVRRHDDDPAPAGSADFSEA